MDLKTGSSNFDLTAESAYTDPDLGLVVVEGRCSRGHTDNTKGKLLGNTPPKLVQLGGGEVKISDFKYIVSYF